MTLYITYDPEFGEVVPDGRVLNWANELEKHVDKSYPNDVKVSVGSEVMLDVIRLWMVRGLFDYRNTYLIFDGKTVEFNEYGNLEKFPTMTTFNILRDIMSEQMAKRNNK